MPFIFSSCPAGAGQIAASAAPAAVQVSPLTPGRPLGSACLAPCPSLSRSCPVPLLLTSLNLTALASIRASLAQPNLAPSCLFATRCSRNGPRRSGPEGASSSDEISGITYLEPGRLARSLQRALDDRLLPLQSPRPVAKDSGRLARPAVSAGHLRNKNSALPSPQQREPRRIALSLVSPHARFADRLQQLRRTESSNKHHRTVFVCPAWRTSYQQPSLFARGAWFGREPQHRVDTTSSASRQRNTPPPCSTMATVSRQPFAPVDGARLKSLASVKNRQNGMSLFSLS